ncbi:baeRF7 domain-containing protein [Micromonospora sp. CPCC 206061]|uniref:baeRF7 domain-containing protein n=1 Tax=Micromonospora sp. CPCC 206061 TaxID=3122410 RepID=UPI003FA543EB
MWAAMPRQRPQVHAVLSGHGGTGGRTVFHGNGEDDTRLRVLQHFQCVDHALCNTVGDQQCPLVLAGMCSLQPVCRKVNSHSRLLPAGVDGAATRPATTSAASSGLVPRPTAAAPRRDRRGRHLSHAAWHRAHQHDPGEVCRAAHHGRVDAPFLSTDAPGWITNSGSLIRVIDILEQAEDLDGAAVATLRRGGWVYAVPAVRMPDRGPVAAILRF